MNDKWENYFSDRIMRITPEGIKLIKSTNIETGISSECSICGFFIRGLEDALSREKYGCCQECTYKWVEPNQLKWKEGWRPTKKERQQHTNLIMNQPTFRVR